LPFWSTKNRLGLLSTSSGEKRAGYAVSCFANVMTEVSTTMESIALTQRQEVELALSDAQGKSATACAAVEEVTSKLESEQTLRA
jgi:hypothetical protein